MLSEKGEKPCFGDYLHRRDIVAAYDARKLIGKADSCATGSLGRVETYEKIIVKLDYAVASAGERLLRDSQPGAALILQEARILRSEAYLELAKALRGMGEGEREKYAGGWDVFRVREKVYGKVPGMPRAPHSPSRLPALSRGMYSSEDPIAYYYAPTREEMARHDRELEQYGKKRDEFFEKLAEICEKKARAD